MAISQRTFLCATIGAAMFWVAMLILASRASKIFAKIIVMCLIFIGLGAQLFQFHHYSNISDTQRQLLKNIVENFDGNLSDKTLLILDESNQLNHIWMFLTENLYGAMAYMYGHPISAIEVCYMPSQEWQFADDLGRKGRCESSANDWSFHPPEAVSGPGYVTKSVQLNKIINKDKIISITIKPNGSVDLNPKLDQYRKNLIHDDSSLAMRYRGVLATQPWVLQPVMFKDQLPSNSYRWDFGNWWSLEIPIRGSGWREAEWEVGYFKHKSSAWKTQKKAVLNFDLLPKNGKYILRGKFDMILNPTIKQSVKVNLNKKNINYQWISNGLFEAEIESNLLQSGINEIEFESEIDSKYYGLSIKLDWFELKPKNY